MPKADQRDHSNDSTRFNTSATFDEQLLSRRLYSCLAGSPLGYCHAAFQFGFNFLLFFRRHTEDITDGIAKALLYGNILGICLFES